MRSDVPKASKTANASWIGIIAKTVRSYVHKGLTAAVRRTCSTEEELKVCYADNTAIPQQRTEGWSWSKPGIHCAQRRYSAIARKQTLIASATLHS